jgi:hypothetical protein
VVKVAAGIFDFTSGTARLSVTDVEAKGGELRAWVEIHAGKRLHYGDYNLRGPRSVSTMASACSKSAAVKDWAEWLGECCYEVIHDTLEGDPPTELYADASTPPGWIVERLIGDVGATSLVGFGRTGKSLLALASACSICSGDSVWLGLQAERGIVLYLDYEADEKTHRWRLSQLCRGTGRPCPKGLHYLRPRLPLAKTVASVARHAATIGATLIIVDSVMLARGGDAFGAESTLALYAALDRIGLPSLLVDHRAKHAAENGDEGPYGSVAGFNSMRCAWGTRTVPVTDGADVRLKNIKANNYGALRDHAWQLRFTEHNQAARFNPVEATAVLPGGEATMKDRILGALLAAGYQGMTAKGVAAEVGTSDNGARAVLSVLKRDGSATQVGGRWVAESQSQQEEAPF